MGIINKKKDDKEHAAEKEDKRFTPKLTEWMRNRCLAELLHAVDCAWLDGINTCGHMDCEWDSEQHEDHPWAQPIHSHYVDLAETLAEKSGKDPAYIESLLNLYDTHTSLTKNITQTVHGLCDNAGITHHMINNAEDPS